MTDCANTESLFRIIQSIPSSKAAPFKRWLTQVGYERVKEIESPELARTWRKAWAGAYWRAVRTFDGTVPGALVRQGLISSPPRRV